MWIRIQIHDTACNARIVKKTQNHKEICISFKLNRIGNPDITENTSYSLPWNEYISWERGLSWLRGQFHRCVAPPVSFSQGWASVLFKTLRFWGFISRQNHEKRILKKPCVLKKKGKERCVLNVKEQSSQPCLFMPADSSVSASLSNLLLLAIDGFSPVSLSGHLCFLNKVGNSQAWQRWQGYVVAVLSSVVLTLLISPFPVLSTCRLWRWLPSKSNQIPVNISITQLSTWYRY